MVSKKIHSLDFGEFLDLKNEIHTKNDLLKIKFAKTGYWRFKNLYEEYVELGGFPEVVLEKNHAKKKEILERILRNYVHNEIKPLVHLKNEQKFLKFLQILASETGKKLARSKLSRSSGISRPTLNAYISALEKTGMIQLVPAYAKNRNRDILKSTKIFFLDNGILSILADLGGETKLKNAIFNQLRKRGKLQYFSLKRGPEIDFIFKKSALFIKEFSTESDRKKIQNLAQKADLKNIRIIGRNLVRLSEDYIWGGQIT